MQKEDNTILFSLVIAFFIFSLMLFFISVSNIVADEKNQFNYNKDIQKLESKIKKVFDNLLKLEREFIAHKKRSKNFYH